MDKTSQSTLFYTLVMTFKMRKRLAILTHLQELRRQTNVWQNNLLFTHAQ